MRICIDASFLVLDKASGLKSYTQTLIHHLLDVDKENQYVLFYNYFLNRHNAKIPLWNGKNTENRICRIPRRILLSLLYKNFNFPEIELFTGAIDIFHSLTTTSPPTKKAKTILSINDLREFYFPQYYKSGAGDALLRKKSLKRTDFVVCISENTRKDIARFLNFPEERILVVYLDLDEKFRKMETEAIAPVMKKYNLQKEYILYVGNCEPRKNIKGILDSYALFKEKFKAHHLLVMTGAGPEPGSGVDRLVRENRFRDSIVFISTPPDDDLVALYNGASCFFFPSLYEGFGIPPLEAMACGCPVVASRASSLPEVVGDAGILCNPQNTEEMAHALWTVLSDEARRKNLIQNGFARAKSFQGRRMAQKTLEVYRKVANG